MTLHHFVTRNLNVSVAGDKIILSSDFKGFVNIGVLPGTGDAARIQLVVDDVATNQGPVTQPNGSVVALRAAAATIVSGSALQAQFDGFYSSSAAGIDEILGLLGNPPSGFGGAFDIFTFEPATGQLSAYDSARARAVEAAEEPDLVPDRSGELFGIGEGVVTTTGASRYALAPLEGGGFVAVWTGLATRASDGRPNGAIGAEVFDSDGSVRVSNFRADPDIGLTSPQTPAVTRLADGGFLTVWWEFSQLGLDQFSIQAQRFDAVGLAVGDAFGVNTETRGLQEAPQAAALSDGGFVVVWQDSSRQPPDTSIAVRAQIFDADGTPRGVEFVANTTTAGTQGAPMVAGLPDGGFVVVYRTPDIGMPLPNIGALAAQKFLADGTRNGPEVFLNATAVSASRGEVAVFSDGGFVVVWESGGLASVTDRDGREVYARLFDPDGTPRGPEFVVNTITLGNQLNPAVAVLSDDRFVVAWDDGSRLEAETLGSIARAQVFDAEGNRIGGEFLLAEPGSPQIGAGPQLAALDDGRFAAIWREPGGTAAKTWLQVFDADRMVPAGDFAPPPPDVTDPVDPPPPDDPGPTGRVQIDAALAEAGTGPYRLVALPDLGSLTLPQIDGGIIAVTGESQRAELLDALAGLGVTVEVVVSERFSESLGLFNAGAVDLILVPVAALVASGSPDAPSAVDGPPLSGPPDVAPLTGAVVGRDGAPIDGLRLVFRPEEDGAATVEALTGPLGQFSLGLPPAVAGRLDADLAFDPGGRDAGAITTADALAVLRLSVGLSAARGRETTAADLVAADVLGTGTVTAADALALLRASVGLPSEAAPRYVLVDAGLAEAPAAGPAVPDLSPIFGVAPLQLTAILVGDVI